MAKPERYEGKFVESADLMASGPVTVEIAVVHKEGTQKAANGRLIQELIIGFKQTEKQFILNKTNERIIRSIYGTKTSEWIGKPLTLCVRYLEEAFGEKDVPSLRVVPPDDKPLPYACRKDGRYGNAKPLGKK